MLIDSLVKFERIFSWRESLQKYLRASSIISFCMSASVWRHVWWVLAVRCHNETNNGGWIVIVGTVGRPRVTTADGGNVYYPIYAAGTAVVSAGQRG